MGSYSGHVDALLIFFFSGHVENKARMPGMTEFRDACSINSFSSINFLDTQKKKESEVLAGIFESRGVLGLF